MKKTSKHFLLIQLLLTILIVNNPFSIDANELRHQSEYERENQNVKNIIVGSSIGGTLLLYYYYILLLVLYLHFLIKI